MMSAKLKLRRKSPVKFAKPGRSEKDKKKSSKKKRTTKQHSFTTSSSIRGSRLSRVITDDSSVIRKSLKHYIVEDLENLNREFHFQRVYMFAQNQEISGSAASDGLNQTLQEKYLQHFRNNLEEISEKCDLTRISNDAVSGLFICMGTYTLFMIEGPEQTLGDYFYHLSSIESKLWQKSKIFLVENYIGSTHFDKFVFCTSDAINTNKKFPPNTITEANLMAQQHVLLMEKITSVVEQLIADIKIKDNDDEDLETILPPDPYNKLLPSAQRIDLCLNSDKFYIKLEDFTKMYFRLTCYKDHDTMFWPVEYNYTPLNIFNRSTYDVNLTFSDYDSVTVVLEDEKDVRPSLDVNNILETAEMMKNENGN